jgi:hypothetical protein
MVTPLYERCSESDLSCRLAGARHDVQGLFSSA